MKLIIDIPKELYKKQLGSNWTGNCVIHDAIVNGTPLPKGHGRLIDADALNNSLRERQKNYEHTSDIRRPINEAVKDGIIIARTHIDYAPIIIEAERMEVNK